jgi:hypothetical protein
MRTNYTLPQKPIDTVAAKPANQITEEYYNHLVGEINRGTIQKAVCRIFDARFNHTSYHLISI